MGDSKPKNIEEYKKWLKKEYKITIKKRSETYYDSVTNKIKRDFNSSEFWIEFTGSLKEYAGEYLVETGYDLLGQGEQVILLTKSFDSFFLKTFRKNILENKIWPNEPENGWLLPDNWYSKIEDIIRTSIVVKYLDGVEFLLDKITLLCKEKNIECIHSLEAKEEGYYAAHLNIRHEFEVPKETWDTRKIIVSIEIQLTTQLQEIIRRLLHKYYEARRIRTDSETTKWQWKYNSNEFATNYLGHILHYTEGMIMGIREKQKKELT